MAATALRELIRLGRTDRPGQAFTFIDLFAGIGGIRTAFERVSVDAFSPANGIAGRRRPTARTSRTTSSPITCSLATSPRSTRLTVPDHDVLTGGFPCQPFSIAGVSKKNSLGRAHGFADATQGTLFFDVARIIDEKRPAAFLLENVKNLRSHDKGRTFEVIRRTLEDDLGTSFTPG